MLYFMFIQLFLIKLYLIIKIVSGETKINKPIFIYCICGLFMLLFGYETSEIFKIIAKGIY